MAAFEALLEAVDFAVVAISERYYYWESDEQGVRVKLNWIVTKSQVFQTVNRSFLFFHWPPLRCGSRFEVSSFVNPFCPGLDKNLDRLASTNYTLIDQECFESPIPARKHIPICSTPNFVTCPLVAAQLGYY